MNQKIKKGFVLFLVMSLCLSGVPGFAFAQEEDQSILSELFSFFSSPEAAVETPLPASPTELIVPIASDAPFTFLPETEEESILLQEGRPEAGEGDPIDENLREEAVSDALPAEEEEMISDQPSEESALPDDGQESGQEDLAESRDADVAEEPVTEERTESEEESAGTEEKLPETSAEEQAYPEAEASRLPEEWRYTVIFDGNGGIGQMSAQGDRINDKGFILPYNTYRRMGYTFAGWNTAPDGSGSAYPDRAKLLMPADEDGAEILLYAQWQPNEYRITYKNVLPGDDNPNPLSYTYGESVALQPLSREGFCFDGWFTDGFFPAEVSTLNEDGLSAKALTVAAKWTPMKYTISFDGNALGRGTVRGTMKDLAGRQCGKTYTLPGNAYRMEGYSFLGWSTDPYAFVPEYHNRARVTDLTLTDGETVTLYAVWQAKSLRNAN